MEKGRRRLRSCNAYVLEYLMIFILMKDVLRPRKLIKYKGKGEGGQLTVLRCFGMDWDQLPKERYLIGYANAPRPIRCSIRSSHGTWEGIPTVAHAPGKGSGFRQSRSVRDPSAIIVHIQNDGIAGLNDKNVKKATPITRQGHTICNHSTKKSPHLKQNTCIQLHICNVMYNPDTSIQSIPGYSRH